MKRILFLLLVLSLTGMVRGQTLSISELFGFPCTNGVCPDGSEPANLIQGSDGNFYGVTQGPGGIFKITVTGQVTVLYTFQQDPKTGLYDQGYDPVALVEGSDGFFYGLNYYGGPNPSSAGTLFKISLEGTGFDVLCKPSAPAARQDRSPMASPRPAMAMCMGPPLRVDF